MKKTVLLLFLLWTLAALPAAGSDFAFRHYTSRNGLSSNTVRAILQDSRGLIWLGVSGGLDSFDGREFLHYALPGTEGGTVQCLYEDSSGTLWVGTDGAAFRLENGALERIPDFPAAEVNAFVEDRDRAIWIGTWEKGLYRYADGQLTAFLDGHRVEDLLVSRDGRLWVADATVEEGLMIYHPASRSFVVPDLSFQDCSPTRVHVMDQDENGDLWLGTWNSGLYRMAAATRTVHRAVPPGLGLNHIHSLIHDGAWNFLIGSDDGLLDVNPQTGEQTLYRNDRKDPSSLSDQFVYPVIRDHEGGIWIGTAHGGVNYIAPGAGQFTARSLTDLVGADEDYIVSCFCEDPDGTLWIGSDNGGLFRYDPVRNTAGRWNAPVGWKERLSTLNIHALLRQGDDLWIGTYTENVLRLDVRTGRIRVYGRPEGLDATSSYAICAGLDGTVWASTNTGICRYDASTDRFTLEKTVGDWIIDSRADADGSLWFATARNGILRRAADGTWLTYNVEGGFLPSNYINSLLPMPQGLFVGTQKGLALVTEEETRSLLEDAEIQKVVFDGNQLWLSTGTGIVRYSLPDGLQEKFGADDGLYASLFSPNAGLVTRDGTIYLGAADGFVSFNPGAVRSNETAPPVLFTRFQASGPGISEDVFQTRGRGPVVLPWRLKDIRISFAALSYCAPQNNRYAYRLEGMDPSWKDLDSENTLTLSQLPAGRYRLQVIACNNSGVWNREGASLSFTIRPHPLLSSLSLALYVLLTAFLGFLLVRWLLRRTEQKSQVRYAQELAIVREEERDDRYQFVSSLSDQMGVPLSGIGVQLERMKEQAKTGQPVRGGLSVIEKNYRMLRSIAGNLEQIRQGLAPADAPEQNAAPDAGEQFLLRLNKLIQDNIAHPDLSVAFLAQEMAISRSGLFAKTKELSGETPNKLINQARLNMAARLLSEGRHTIGEICYMTGFSSPSYFSKSFTAQFGVTPHEWAQLPPIDVTDRSEPS